ncbi:hypothetical protein ACFOGJ_01320 [Marinibaculum pumilum]|uniref:DUF4145 domain-containing protein n=1 Tax=Marinibaculum pumilum TaxID=1766165 RepID=A0ABV7KU88_9PROT
MKKVDLIKYFNLGENLHVARRATSNDNMSVGDIWISIYYMPTLLREFIQDDNGFTTCKHVADELATMIEDWLHRFVFDNNSPPQLKTDNFKQTLEPWHYTNISAKIDEFRSVFSAECRIIDVYSVEEISIYNTSRLVSKGSDIIPRQILSHLPDNVVSEFDNAGRCLAFELPTACGFHSLRGLELVMEKYIQHFGRSIKSLKSWNDYIREIEKLANDGKSTQKPSNKVSAMLDRLRELERNPLMHPRDQLDSVQADMLFRLCAITVVEIIRDITKPAALLANIANSQNHAKPAIQ